MYRLFRKIIRLVKGIMKYSIPIILMVFAFTLVVFDKRVTIQRVVWNTYNSTDAQHIIGRPPFGFFNKDSSPASVTTPVNLAEVLEQNSSKSVAPDKKKNVSSSVVHPLKKPMQQQPITQSARSAVTKLIILAYWRGGSTFVGTLFEHSPQSFYIFEPLTGYQSFDDGATITLHSVTGTERKIIYPGNIESRAIENILNCELDKLDVELLTNPHMEYSNDTHSFFVCLGSNRTLANVRKCLPLMKTRCKGAKLTVAKVLRIGMSQLVKILTLNSEFKVIHFVRDPRGMISSRLLRHGKSSIRKKMLQQDCGRLETNHDSAKAYMLKNPHRLMELRYEDLARQPLKVAEKMFKFIGMDFSSEIQKYISSVTSYKGKEDDCYLCTNKKSSSKTAFKWRNSIPEWALKHVDKYCGNITYSRYGYVKLTFGDLKNMNISSVEDRP